MIMSYYHEGKRDYVPNESPINPYPRESEANHSWEKGWLDAWYEDVIPGAFG